MLRLGYLLQHGVWGPADPAAAMDWYYKAAAAGHPPAMTNLALLLLQGRGATQVGGRRPAGVPVSCSAPYVPACSCCRCFSILWA